MTITALLSGLPNRTMDQATFDAAMGNLMTNLPLFGGQANALAASLNTIAAGGAYAIPYVFASSIGPVGFAAGGRLSFANSTNAQTTTQVYMDTKSSGGDAVSASLNDFNASTSTIKGVIRIVKMGDTSKWARFSISAYAQNGGGLYGIATVVALDNSGANPFADGDPVMLFFQRTGDKGDTGLTGVSALTYLHVRHEAANGVGPGSSATTLDDRVVNAAKVNTISGASLASNQITLPAGTYDMDGVLSITSSATGAHQALLYNVTGAAYAVIGRSINGGIPATIKGRFTIGVTSVFKIRHYIASGSSNIAFGNAASSGQGEVYLDAYFTKVG